MRLRRATLDDAKLLFDWRNDLLTRQNSRTTEPLEWDSHIAFLQKTLPREDRKIFVAETSEPVGTVRIDYGEPSELSWTIAPNHRGKGLGASMVKAAIGIAPRPLFAEIKPSNIASIKIAERAGFSVDGQHAGLLRYLIS